MNRTRVKGGGGAGPRYAHAREHCGVAMEGDEGAAASLLGWLETSGGLASLRGQCSGYKEPEKVREGSSQANPATCPRPQAVFKLSLTVDPLELLQYSGRCARDHVGFVSPVIIRS